jgi:DNA-binding NarL/FixJ family response regulator
MIVSKKSAASKKRKRIVIVDDHPMTRLGMTQLINGESDLEVAGEASSAAEAFGVIASARPDLVLADITMPGKSGLEMLKDIHALHPELPVLVVSMHDESLYAERVLHAGGRGYIMKQEGGKKLMEAIRQVLSGKIFVSERIASRILEIFSGATPSTESSPLARLTDREFEVFRLFGEGLGTRELADKLHVSAKTVEVHRANIKAKLKIKTAAELMRYAFRWTDAGSEEGNSKRSAK